MKKIFLIQLLRKKRKNKTAIANYQKSIVFKCFHEENLFMKTCLSDKARNVIMEKNIYEC